MKQRIVLGYRGDFETTAAIRWLADTCEADVVTVTLDLGQRRDPAEARERALAAGAVRAHVIDARDEFARDCVLPALQRAEAGSGDPVPAAAMAWPLIARKLVEVAEIEGAAAVAHASRAAGLDDAIRAIRPDMLVFAPVREWQMDAAQLETWALEHGLPAPHAAERACRIDETLWGRTITWADGSAPDAPTAPRLADEAVVEISFEGATPVAINGVPMPLTELIEIVSVIAAPQGIGRVEQVATDSAGTVRRTVHDAPAAAVLQMAYAHRAPDAPNVRLKLAHGQQTVIPGLVQHA